MLIKTEILGFVLKQEPSTPPNLMMGVKTIWELCLFEVEPFGSLWRLQVGIFTFLQKETGADNVAMATALRVSFCFFFDADLWCQVSRTLLQYFQRYRLFSIFHVLVANNMTSSLI